MALIVISVGTSLLTNNGDVKKLEDSLPRLEGHLEMPAHLDTIRSLAFSFGPDGASQLCIKPREIDPSMLSFSREFLKIYLNEDEIRKNITNRTNRSGEKDHCPAEISTLYLYYQQNAPVVTQNRPKDTVVLITTATADALYCAKMIEVMLKRIAFFSDRCDVSSVEAVQSLTVNSPCNWIQGMANLHNLLRNLVDRYRDVDRRVLLRTGGYKEFSSDLKILAMAHTFESYYLFESSDSLLKTYLFGGWPTDISDVINGTTC